MKAVSKAEVGKGGNIILHKVLKVITDAGELDPEDVLLLNSNEIDEYKRWEERRYAIAKDAMVGIIANSHNDDYRYTERGCSQNYTYKLQRSDIAHSAVLYADALLSELSGK